MTSSTAAIVPITLRVNGQTGLTLWAPPWEDEDGEEWQGFLGDGSKILLFPSAQELAAFVASGEENDLSDHPAWGQVLKATPDQLRPSGDDHYDLDEVYEWASGEPDPVHVSALANVVDMVARIADCCDDGALRRLVEGTPAYAELVDEDVTYQGRDGRKRWNELGDIIADSWERAIRRVEDWLNWRGDFSHSEFRGGESTWERIGAEPIAMRFSDVTYLTVRGNVPVNAAGDETETVFLGADQEVAVFTEVADLARYCRTVKRTELDKLEWWEEVADLEDDEEFRPGEDVRYDLRKPSTSGAELLREIAGFCNLEADTAALDEASINRDDWAAIVAEIRTCLRETD
jgi:hypothetical protein